MKVLRILVTAPPILPSIDDYREALGRSAVEVVTPNFEFRESLSEDELIAALSDIDGILCGDDQLTRRVFEACPRLRAISKWGTGIDSIDAEAARDHGIELRRVPDVFADPVADTVMAYVLMHARQIQEKDNVVRSGGWSKVLSHSLRECTIGIVGVGHVGMAVARRAAAFGMTVLGNDIRELDPADFSGIGLEVVGFEELLDRADFISLNCDLNETSRKIIGRDELERMRPWAYLINTARGPLIEQSALIEAIEQGSIAGAGLDVFEVEPLPSDSELRSLSSVMLSPHNSNGSPAVFKRVDLESLGNLMEGLGRADVALDDV